jgi:hypothetical protein
MPAAKLYPPIHKEGVRYSGRYGVEFDGDLIVEGSRDPEHDLARALLARGLTGKVTMLDANTGMPRTIIDIEKAAKLTVEENSSYGPRVRKWKPMPDIARQLCEGFTARGRRRPCPAHHTPRG